MLGKILTNTIERLENYQLTHPEEVSFMQLEIEALKAHMKWMRSHWEEPTMENIQIKNLERNSAKPAPP